jgi:hypothetical protein
MANKTQGKSSLNAQTMTSYPSCLAMCASWCQRKGFDYFSMTAKDKFDRGQRVEMTKEALAQGLQPKRCPRFGTVVGYSKGNKSLVCVQIDGQGWAHAYHMDFWKPIESRTPAETIV